MSLKAEFNEDEWYLLSALPAMIGAAMGNASPSGVIGNMKELSASMRTTVHGLKDHADSPLVQALLEKAGNWDETRGSLGDYRGRALDRLKTSPGSSSDALEQLVLDDCRRAAQLVDQRCTPIDAAAYRAWVLQIAKAVAEAAREGGFLGVGGVRVSAEEGALLNRLEIALSGSHAQGLS